MPGTLTLTFTVATTAFAGGGSLRHSSEHRSDFAAFMRPPIAESGPKCGPSMRAFAATAAAVPVSLYEVLRIRQDASATEIKSAYRSLAKVYHPDSGLRRPENDDRDFIEIHDAYETLSDPAARAIYDMTLRCCGGSRRPLVSPNGGNGVCRSRRWETDQCW